MNSEKRSNVVIYDFSYHSLDVINCAVLTSWKRVHGALGNYYSIVNDVCIYEVFVRLI